MATTVPDPVGNPVSGLDVPEWLSPAQSHEAISRRHFDVRASPTSCRLALARLLLVGRGASSRRWSQHRHAAFGAPSHSVRRFVCRPLFRLTLSVSFQIRSRCRSNPEANYMQLSQTISPAPHPLREAREISGLSLRRVDAITGIDFRRLHLLEQGLRPSSREIELLAAVYRIVPAQLRAVLGIG